MRRARAIKDVPFVGDVAWPTSPRCRATAWKRGLSLWLTPKHTKLELYLNAGVRLVWLMDPRTETVEELRPAASGAQGKLQSRLLHADASDVLEDGEVLAGFRLPVADVFA
jgi:Uma2 family endonuclease